MPINLPAEPSAAQRAAQELEQMTTALADCVLSTISAQDHVALWADAVSTDVEQRLGTGVGDKRNWAESNYAAALDAFSRAQRLQHHIADETAAIVRLLVEEG